MVREGTIITKCLRHRCPGLRRQIFAPNVSLMYSALSGLTTKSLHIGADIDENLRRLGALLGAVDFRASHTAED
jgi:hypothetical protein